jgi:hypothetical protein
MLDTHYKYDRVENMVGLLDVIDKESCASFFMDNVTRTIVIVYTIQHERCFDSLERL